MRKRSMARFLLSGPAVAAAVVLSGTAALAAATPGAPGIGDPYFPLDGNGGYVVSHYGISLTYQPSTDLLAGTTTISARATQDLSRFDLDFLLKVTSVRVGDVAATFDSTADGELVVTPAVALPKGAEFSVTVTYADVPSSRSLNGRVAWRRTPTGAIASTTPEIAQWWFPSNNHPLDKATFDVSVAVPTGFAAVSNGVAVGEPRSRPDGTVEWRWHTAEPIATYHALLAIGRFEIERSTVDGIPVVNALAADLDPETAAAARSSLALLPEVLDFTRSIFGPFPFSALGAVVVNPPFRFANENPTRPVYRGDFISTDLDGGIVMTHMISDQWFGGSASFTRWRDFWMDDGLGAFMETMWVEHLGLATSDEIIQDAYERRPADDPFWQVLPGDPGPGLGQLSLITQERGGEMFCALRTAVGDDAFFTILHDWATAKRLGNGSTAEFIQLAEQVSGQSLQKLFDTWLFTKGKPAVGPAPDAGQAATAGGTAPGARPSWPLQRA
jgi:aminopeptidase N